jgi:hypothetical protein
MATMCKVHDQSKMSWPRSIEAFTAGTFLLLTLALGDAYQDRSLKIQHALSIGQIAILHVGLKSSP